MAELCPEDSDEAEDRQQVGQRFKSVEKDIVRNSILDTSLRIDGRDL